MGAELWRADLQGANLGLAGLQGADLRGADLQDAKGLTVEQLLEVKTLYQVEGLDPELEKKLKAQKPELFQRPKKKITLTLSEVRKAMREGEDRH